MIMEQRVKRLFKTPEHRSALFPKEVKTMGKGQEKGKKGKDNKPKLSTKEKKKRKQKKEAA